MRTKEEILKQCGFGSLTNVSAVTIKYCQLEALIDIRDEIKELKQLLYSIGVELNDLNRK